MEKQQFSVSWISHALFELSDLVSCRMLWQNMKKCLKSIWYDTDKRSYGSGKTTTLYASVNTSTYEAENSHR